MGTLLRHGSEEQKREYLPKIASGEIRLQAFGVTEPEAGTDTTSLSTTARRSPDGDHYTVNGRKIYISRVQHSDFMILLARTTPRDRVQRKSEGLSVFIFDLREAIGNGLTVKPRRVMINNETNELLFENLKIPESALIGEEGVLFVPFVHLPALAETAELGRAAGHDYIALTAMGSLTHLHIRADLHLRGLYRARFGERMPLRHRRHGRRQQREHRRTAKA